MGELATWHTRHCAKASVVACGIAGTASVGGLWHIVQAVGGKLWLAGMLRMFGFAFRAWQVAHCSLPATGCGMPGGLACWAGCWALAKEANDARTATASALRRSFTG